jgi:potassium-dependent mechanosensitive channel
MNRGSFTKYFLYKNLFLACLFFAGLVGFAQKSPEREYLISPKKDTVFIQSINLTDIPSNLEKSYTQLKRIENILTQKPEMLKFDSVYQIGMKNILANKKRIQEDNVYNSLQALNNIQNEWLTYKEKLNNWKEYFNNRLLELDNSLFELHVLLASWKKTRTAAQEASLPSDVLETLQEFIASAERLERRFVSRQNDILRKQNSLTELSFLIDDVLTFIENESRIIRSEFFRRDSPPIWRAADSSVRTSTSISQLKDTFQSNMRGLSVFLNNNQNKFVLHLIIFVVLWLMYFLLSRHARKISPDKEMDDFTSSTEIISKHGLSALVISLFLSIWIYPALISPVSNLIRFIYVLIAIYILPKYIDRRLRKILLAILLLFLVNEVQYWMVGKEIVPRIILLFESLLASWILYMIIKKESPVMNQVKYRNWGIILYIIPVFLLFLAVSIIGNITGFVELSVLLSDSVVNGILNLIVLIVTILVLNRTVHILLNTSFLQASFIIRNHKDIIEKRSRQFIYFFGFLIWLRSLLNLMGVYDLIYEWFVEAAQTSWEVGTTTIELSNIINFILVIIITVIAYRLVRIILKEDVFPRVTLPRGVPGAISMVVTYFIVGYGFFVAIGAAGVDLGQFGLIAGALGVGIGFGLQGIVANFIAGLVLAFERPIQVGDEIQLATMMGVVTSIGVRSTTIKTYDGSEVIVPNSDLITKDVTNWTLSDRKKRRDIFVSVAYGTKPQQVIELMKRVASGHPDVLKVPAPWALFEGFGDNSLNFRIRIWTTMDTGLTVKSEVAMNIYDALEAEGIEIPFPQRDLHIRTIDASVLETGRKITRPKPKQGRKGRGNTEKDQP